MNIKTLKKLFIAVYVFGILTLPSFMYAECTLDGGKLCNPIKADNVPDVIHKLLTGVLKVGIPVVALAIIYCGFLFVTAVGNTEKIKKARETLIYTLIGAAILLGAYAIAELIDATVKGLT